ncbi:hypothetical protein ACMSIO_21105 [Pseudomonas benzopyrenica]|uniref:hypothetical protein n=1 Tax=Pseudomonas benzopyrenica TaxID=2993566 RepID=UPI0039C2DBF4
MMNTNSKRYELQQLMEGWIGCTDPANLSNYRSQFEQHTLTLEMRNEMNNALISDGASIFYKGAHTFADAIAAASKGYQSWAIIKLYYSSFYLLRALFAARGYGIVKCKGIYTLKSEIGATPVKRDGQTHKGEKTRGDHKTTIYIFEKEMGNGELLLSNSIAGSSVFDWMMEAREAVNYRHATFSEPDFDFFEPSLIEENGALRWVNAYLEDQTGAYLFLEQHCCISVPLYLIKKVKSEFETRLNVNTLLSEEQCSSLIKILTGTGLETSNRFLSLFDATGPLG